MMDLLDPTRIGRDSTKSGSTSRIYSDSAKDWDHANAVIYDPASESYYLSQRHQDAVLKIKRGAGELVWILGNHENYAPQFHDKLLSPSAGLEWQYHQHAVELTPLGLGLYDNGNYRAAAYQAPQDSWGRAVIFAIDEQAMTASITFSYGAPSGPDYFYSRAMGDADWQPETGNCLFVNAVQSQLVEVTPQGERVFEMTASGSSGIYRAERIADLRDPPIGE